ncbi:KGK domain-containing protein [Nostoc sp. MS1]|uniref:KGK domain-containing protein n=1 Tax=Nostoc sp. MS1 TaxID=2764711 RepID=UPI001CC7CCE0|nr:KGK domain-containing protein [Nostoc sp. MS1]BCL39050.1 hypothetical protein NSMS1_54970 [Nostoc sp. MS1]
MEEKFKPISCNGDDVLEVGENIYKISKLLQTLNQASNSSLAYKLQQELSSQGVNIQQSHSEIWFSEGLDCKILNLGSSSWKQGKLKFNISVEFYVEQESVTTNNIHLEISQPESPLDDLRRLIKEDNS